MPQSLNVNAKTHYICIFICIVLPETEYWREAVKEQIKTENEVCIYSDPRKNSNSVSKWVQTPKPEAVSWLLQHVCGGPSRSTAFVDLNCLKAGELVTCWHRTLKSDPTFSQAVLHELDPEGDIVSPHLYSNKSTKGQLVSRDTKMSYFFIGFVRIRTHSCTFRLQNPENV